MNSIENTARQTMLSNKWLKEWPDDVLVELASHSFVKHYPTDSLVNLASQQVSHMWLIAKGSLELRLDSDEGNRSILGYVLAGDAMGFNCVLDDNSPIYNVYSHGMTTLVHIPKSALLDVFARKPELLWTWVRVYAERLKQSSDFIAYDAMASLRERLVHQLLLLMSQQSAGTQAPYVIDIHLSQERLAFLLSTTRQRVNRELCWLRDNGLITYKAMRITILDAERLKQMCGKTF